MTDRTYPSTIDADGRAVSSLGESPLPVSHNKVVLVMDLVESVRLMASDEASVVANWHGFLQRAREEVLPRHGGRLVKSLGDGILVEFDNAVPAIRASFELHRHFERTNRDLEESQQMWLRAGLNATHLYVDQDDVFGHGVNLAARVAGLARPGESVITASVHDELVDGVDAILLDMGESYLKHWPEPIRTWAATPPSADVWQIKPSLPVPADDFRVTIAVLPFVSRSQAPEHFVVGELLADGVIVQLSRSQQLRVISRLSTTVLRGRENPIETAQQQLQARFVLSGSYVSMGEKVLVMAQLSDTRSNEVIWADRLSGEVMDVLQQDSELIHTLAARCAEQLLHTHVQQSASLALPRLDSSTLMLGAITLMHRSTQRDLERSQQLLDALIERHKRAVAPWAWMAKWHIMQVVQGASQEPVASFQRAIDIADRALDLSPDSALALAVKGHAMCHLGKDVDGSLRLLEAATHANPNDPMAWLYSGVWSTMWGSAEQSVEEASNAVALSPLDPQRYYFEMMLATCHAALGEWDKCLSYCRSSLRKNRYHLPTMRTAMIALYEVGLHEEAQDMMASVRTLQPSLTLSSYLKSGGDSPLRKKAAAVMGELGLPPH